MTSSSDRVTLTLTLANHLSSAITVSFLEIPCAGNKRPHEMLLSSTFPILFNNTTTNIFYCLSPTQTGCVQIPPTRLFLPVLRPLKKHYVCIPDDPDDPRDHQRSEAQNIWLLWTNPLMYAGICAMFVPVSLKIHRSKH